jgi:hypothetical protein
MILGAIVVLALVFIGLSQLAQGIDRAWDAHMEQDD